MAARIITTSARGPFGLTDLQIAMGVRGRKLEPQTCGFIDKRGQWIGVCRLPGLPAELHGFDRLLALAVPALQDAWPAGAGGQVKPSCCAARAERGLGEQGISALSPTGRRQKWTDDYAPLLPLLKSLR